MDSTYNIRYIVYPDQRFHLSFHNDIIPDLKRTLKEAKEHTSSRSSYALLSQLLSLLNQDNPT